MFVSVSDDQSRIVRSCTAGKMPIEEVRAGKIFDASALVYGAESGSMSGITQI